jgi:hypothetical protein
MLARLLGVLALGAGISACTGVLDGPHDGAGPGPGLNTGGTSTLGPGATQSAPGYKAIHRLNKNEYNATVADVLGTMLQPANGSWRDGEINGFDNIADVQLVDVDQYQRYFDAAGALADDVFALAPFKAKFVTCATPDDACVGGIIGKLGLHLFRRPLEASEVVNYKAVYAAAVGLAETHENGLKHVLRSLLSSAEFLYRIELDPDPSSIEKHPLNPYELASRLSYFLWSSAPDDALLAAAADKSLLGDAILKASIDRLLADPNRVTRFVRNFYGQWLGARRVADHAVAPDVYPTWNPQLADSLAAEMYAYFADFLATDRSYLEFLTADVNYVDAPLATLYGMPVPAGAGIQKVQVTTDQRKGFLGLGGFLAQSSLDRRTSPTLRGRWIMINLLCTHPPSPPDDVPKIEVAAGMTDLSQGNVRAVLEKHRTEPKCASCHALFDPYGVALEQFDGIGAFRTTYKDGSPIDPSTQLLDGTQLSSLSELAEWLTREPLFKQCIADNLFSYGMGRVLGNADRPYLDGVVQGWAGGTEVPSLRRLIHSLVLSDSFRSRSGVVAP